MMFDSLSKEEVTKEFIEKAIYRTGLWNGYSHEWSFSTFNLYFIAKIGSGFVVKVSCDDFSIEAKTLNTFEDAFMALEQIDTTLKTIARKMTVKPSV